MELLKRRLPLFGWLEGYNLEAGLADLVAGLTVGLTVIPQSLAYATLAGLETQYGLYSAFMGCFVYALFGGCKEITIGPTALMSLMTYQQVIKGGAHYGVLLAFLAGLLQLLMAPLRLGVLVEWISEPVTVGFTAATSVVIVGSQLKGLLGLSFSSDGFVDTLRQVALHIHETSPSDATMGLLSILILLFMKKIKNIFGVDKMKPTPRQKVLSRSLWLLSLSRNAIVVLTCSLVAYSLSHSTSAINFKLTGAVRAGFPPLALPPFSTTIGNRTVEFTEMVSDLGFSIVLVPIIAVLGNIAIAKAFMSGGKLDATQELVTLGLCNVLGSFVSAMPVTGSFSRSAVNHASGVKTPIGGIYTGILVLLAVGLLTPYFFFIPKASLASVIICAVIFMIEYEVIPPMWRASKKDLVPMVSTFVVCLFYSVEVGILVGVGINIAILLFFSSRPNMNIQKMETTEGVEYMKIMPTSDVYFPGVEHLRNALLSDSYSHLPIVFDCSLMHSTDFTTARVISSLLSGFEVRKRPIYFYNVQPTLLQALAPICDKNFVHLSTQDEIGHLLIGEGRELKEVIREEGRSDVGQPLLSQQHNVTTLQIQPSTTPELP